MSEDDIKIIEGRLYRRWSKEELTKPRLKAKLSFEESFQMLVNKCMTCPPEERPHNIYMLFWSTPKAWKDEELNQELEEAIETVEYSTPRTWCGVPINEDVVPGIKEEIDETKWEQLFHAILNCANRRNLLIPMERTEIVTEGRVE